MSWLAILAAFGLSYVVLDSSLLEPVRKHVSWWRDASCYFCVGFWAGMICRVLDPTFVIETLHWGAADVILHGLAASGLSGWLDNQLIRPE